MTIKELVNAYKNRDGTAYDDDAIDVIINENDEIHYLIRANTLEYYSDREVMSFAVYIDEEWNEEILKVWIL